MLRGAYLQIDRNELHREGIGKKRRGYIYIYIYIYIYREREREREIERESAEKQLEGKYTPGNYSLGKRHSKKSAKS